MAQGYILGESKGAEPRGRPQGQRPVVRNTLYNFVDGIKEKKENMATVGVIGGSGLYQMRKIEEMKDALKKIRRGEKELHACRTIKVDSLKVIQVK